MLWRHYVFRRGSEVHEMWDPLFDRRSIRLLYVAGRGFDLRAQSVMKLFVHSVRSSVPRPERAELLLVGMTGYQLSQELRDQTEQNAIALEREFSALGEATRIDFDSSASGEDDISASTALRIGVEKVLAKITNHTDIVMDVSSLPRVAFLALMTGVLQRLIIDKHALNPLFANGVNFQILVAEDASLDAKIQSEDPSNDLIALPGFSSALHAESLQDWPLVWFPILGENRTSQLQKVMASSIPHRAEICPILPHPSRDPRRADKLLVEYRSLLETTETPTANILYVHEANPFEAYRQLLAAMKRYCESLSIIGGCRLVVTPLASKLVTLGAGLACFEMRPATMDQNFGVAISYAQPQRYAASVDDLRSSTPDISALLLTGQAYSEQEAFD